MRLLHAKTRELHLFPQNPAPYAVLSHRWIDDEVSYEAINEGGAEIRRKIGYEKIDLCCKQAIKDKIEYIWVDSCCIQDSSSAELQESINTMYKWYQQAEVCYVYLNDVPVATAFDEQNPSFDRSKWFTRGWTLQELIAPANVRFYSREWSFLGTKSDLRDKLHEITNINRSVLDGTKDIQAISIARRMSWASQRQTRRTEDIAYCLMGLFDVNMPMLYGEGEKAFIRLQEEIMKRSDDHSIFAWANPEVSPNVSVGLLAPHPAYFKDSANFVPYHATEKDALLVTEDNTGLSLKVTLYEDRSKGLIASLNCTHRNMDDSFAHIHLLCVDGDRSQYQRVNAASLGVAPLKGQLKRIHVRQDAIPRTPSSPRSRWFCLSKSPAWDKKWTTPQWRVAVQSDAVNVETGEQIADSEKGDWLDSKRMSSPFEYRYRLPLKANSLAIAMRLKLDSAATSIPYDAHVMIGKDDSGQIGIVYGRLRPDETLENNFTECWSCPFRYELSLGSQWIFTIDVVNGQDNEGITIMQLSMVRDRNRQQSFSSGASSPHLNGYANGVDHETMSESDERSEGNGEEKPSARRGSSIRRKLTMWKSTASS